MSKNSTIKKVGLYDTPQELKKVGGDKAAGIGKGVTLAA
jgi:hypothetical protein